MDETETVGATQEIEVTLVTRFEGSGGAVEGASEIVAFEGGFLFATNGDADTVDVFDIATGELAATIDLAAAVAGGLPGELSFDGVQSVAVSEGFVVAAVETVDETDAPTPQPGAVVILPFDDAVAGTVGNATVVATGVLPDSVSISPDGRFLLVANEGEFNAESDLLADAPGGITIVDLQDLDAGPTTIEFGADELAAAEAAGLRIHPDAEPGLDLEPEFTAFSPDGTTAYVSLQENNGFLVVTGFGDAPSVSFLSAGSVDFASESALDPLDDGTIDIGPAPVTGLRMPDALVAFDVGGTTYIASANEGDGRGDGFTEADEGVVVATGVPMEEAQEVGVDVPDTAATGSFTASLDQDASTITVEGTFSDLTSPLFPVGGADGAGNPETPIHIHLGDAGSNGPIFRNLEVSTDAGGLSGSFSGTFDVTEEEAETFLADGYYVNLHTQNFNGGELRGQITLEDAQSLEPAFYGDEARGSDLAAAGVLDETAFPTSVTADALPMEEAQEVDADVPDTAATGSFEAALDEEAMTISVTGSFSDLTSALFPVGGEDSLGNPESPIHIHVGEAGTNGPIAFNLAVDAADDGRSGTFSGTFPVTEEQAALFRDDGYYINLHTQNFQSGELRGQIDLPDTTTFSDVAEGDLSRLIYSSIDGDTDGDGDIDELVTFGSRSFTIFDTAGDVVFDSGPAFERIVAEIAPERFNNDDGETLGTTDEDGETVVDNRSDAKGPEPEAIAFGEIDGRSYLFIGAERDSGVFVYNVDDPANAQFVTYIDGFANDNVSPESIVFIPAEESASGSPQIAVAYEISGTTSLYDVALDEDVTTVDDLYAVALGREFDVPGLNFWSGVLEANSLDFVVGFFDDSMEFANLIDGLTDEEAIDLVTNNALGRDATDEEQAEFQPIVADTGFDQLFLALLADDTMV